MSVGLLALPFYWAIIYNGELSNFSITNINDGLVPIMVGLVPLSLICLEFFADAVVFQTKNAYYPAGVCAAYLGVDYLRY